MTDEVSNLVLEHLRHIRGAVDAVRTEQRDQRDRLTVIDGHIAVLRRDVGEVGISVHACNLRLDRIADRLERIETRLGLIDA